MKRVFILVEGQTEETFVRDILQPHLQVQDIYPQAILAATKVVKSGPNFKGGLTDYAKPKKQILNLLADTSVAAVTTMFDLYGLPAEFPGYVTRPLADNTAKVRHLEAALAQDINHPRFKPYLQIHEFEAFLFVNPTATNTRLVGVNIEADLQRIRAQFPSPEDINDNPATAPSKRILNLFSRYRKTIHGPAVVKNVGLEQLRRECPHFNEWLTWLEGLGA